MAPPFAYQRGVGDGARRPQGGDCIRRAASDMPLLLGADNQVAMRKNCLDMGRDPFTLGKTAFAVIMPAQRPQVGAIVDIEGHFFDRQHAPFASQRNWRRRRGRC